MIIPQTLILTCRGEDMQDLRWRGSSSLSSLSHSDRHLEVEEEIALDVPRAFLFPHSLLPGREYRRRYESCDLQQEGPRKQARSSRSSWI
jgi:hypothetical protein